MIQRSVGWAMLALPGEPDVNPGRHCPPYGYRFTQIIQTRYSRLHAVLMAHKFGENE
jgi:hypothetical protein